MPRQFLYIKRQIWYDEESGTPKTRREIEIAIDNAVINRDDLQLSHPCAKGFYYVTVKEPVPGADTEVERNGIPFTIQMNEPMRYEGLTFFQASYGPPGAMPGQKMYSVFEVVRNPADKWPEYSLWIVTFGMFVTFMIKLFSFLTTGSRKSRHV